MPWQQHVADVALEVDDRGRWIYRTIIVTVQRQSGKTTLTGPISLHRCLLKPDARVWLTAQRRQDARDIWLDVIARMTRSPLASIAAVRRSNGSEALTFRNGATYRIFAPSEDALHGRSNDLVMIDEGWAFDLGQGLGLEQAILPTFATTGGQLVLTSTAGTAESTWLAGYVARGRAAVEADRRDGIAYFEWSLADEHVDDVVAGLDPDATSAERSAALDLILAAHPAAGHTLRLDALEQAADAMSPGDFLRAYGNRWTRTAESVVPAHLWAAAAAPAWPPPPAGVVALAFDVALDRSDASICAAWREHDGAPIRVDLIDYRPGAAWLPARLRDLVERWGPVAVGHDKVGPAGDVADELRRAGLDLAPVDGRAYAAACSAFLAAITDGRLQHPSAAALDSAVAAAATRRLGDAWAWSRRASAASISPLIAATIACWAYDHRGEPAPMPLIVSRRR